MQPKWLVEQLNMKPSSTRSVFFQTQFFVSFYLLLLLYVVVLLTCLSSCLCLYIIYIVLITFSFYVFIVTIRSLFFCFYNNHIVLFSQCFSFWCNTCIKLRTYNHMGFEVLFLKNWASWKGWILGFFSMLCKIYVFIVDRKILWNGLLLVLFFISLYYVFICANHNFYSTSSIWWLHVDNKSCTLKEHSGKVLENS